jgi:hypothetical protein
MTTYNLSVTPNSMNVQLQAQTGIYTSSLNGSTQTLDRDGMKWVMTLNYVNLQITPRAEMMALIAELRGQANRVRVEAYDNPDGGAYGGTPLVNGASQTGNTLNIDGATPLVSGWIARGDYFAVDVNGEPELKIATSSASSDAGGNVTLTFQPKLRASPADGASIYTADSVTPPKGIFMLAGPSNGWGSSPGPSGPFTSISLQLIEDILATQP